VSLLRSRQFAAFIVEPVQAENGVRIPDPLYLQAAEALCRETETLFVLDEVQTGLHRTGPFLAAQHFRLEPDMVILAKALSGGLVPSGAVLFSDEIFESVYSSLSRAFVHTSTYSENGLAMRAGLATLDVLEDEQLGTRAGATGEYLRDALRLRLSRYEMVADVRGLGLLSAIAFRAPRSLRLRASFEALQRVHGGLFGQMLVTRLFRDQDVLTQICGNDFMALKIAPPLVVSEVQVDRFVDAVEQVIADVHSSVSLWADVLGLVARMARI
jgi:ornithine--oxo-acid transaminase